MAELDLRSLYVGLLKKALLNDLHIENDAILVAMLQGSLQGYQVPLESLINIRESPAYGLVDRAKSEGAVINYARPLAGGAWEAVDLQQLNFPWHTMIGRKRL